MGAYPIQVENCADGSMGSVLILAATQPPLLSPQNTNVIRFGLIPIVQSN